LQELDLFLKVLYFGVRFCAGLADGGGGVKSFISSAWIDGYAGSGAVASTGGTGARAHGATT
jgi:hypothetical protein